MFAWLRTDKINKFRKDYYEASKTTESDEKTAPLHTKTDQFKLLNMYKWSFVSYSPYFYLWGSNYGDWKCTAALQLQKADTQKAN